LHANENAELMGQMAAIPQVRGSGPATFFLPRWGSRVRIPSSAPENQA